MSPVHCQTDGQHLLSFFVVGKETLWLWNSFLMRFKNTTEEKKMPRTRGESIFFTAITAWMMVYVMTVYNTVLATGSFTNTTFLIALKGMWIEYIIIGLLAYFVSGHLSKMCAFRVCQLATRPIFIHLCDQTFTVIWQVASPVWSVSITDMDLPPTLHRIILWPIAKILSWHFRCSLFL